MLLILLLVLLVVIWGLPHYPAARTWGPAPSFILFLLAVGLVLYLLFGGGGLPSLHCR